MRLQVRAARQDFFMEVDFPTPLDALQYFAKQGIEIVEYIDAYGYGWTKGGDMPMCGVCGEQGVIGVDGAVECCLDCEHVVAVYMEELQDRLSVVQTVLSGVLAQAKVLLRAKRELIEEMEALQRADSDLSEAIEEYYASIGEGFEQWECY